MTGARPAALAALMVSLLAAPAEARPAWTRGADVPLGPAPELTGAHIGSVSVQRLDVFDPSIKGENWWIFRAANKLHMLTRETVIRRELLFNSGEPWDPLRVIESERNLRANGSFRRAEIAPVRDSSGTVNVFVRTQDAWTTNLKLSAATEGGRHSFGFGFEEDNLLGYGKSVSIERSQSGASRSNAVGYGDPRFLGSRLRLNLGYARGSTGDTGLASLTKPFYALESARAQSVAWSRSLTDAVIPENGEDFSKYRERRRQVEASVGARLNADRLFVQRVEAGWYSDRAQYDPLADTVPGTLPTDRELSGPTLGYAWVQPRYVKETYIDRMERVEDFNLGNELAFRGGWMGRAVGSDRDRLIYNVSDQQGLSLGPGRFVIGRIGAGGRVARSRAENALITAGLTGFWKTRWRGDHTWVAHLEGSRGRALERQSSVILGGASGLRGYKVNSFVGGQAVLLNLEDRFFFEGERLHLIRLGGAVFLDCGTVAREGAKLAWRGLKTDVGFGLRVSPTRSRSGSVVRVDVAYALNGGPGGSRWVLSVRGAQAFSLFNSAASRVEPAPGTKLY